MLELKNLGDRRIGPVFVCDGCGQRIDSIGMAMVAFQSGAHSEEPGTTIDFELFHKVRCDPGREWATMELFDFFVRAFANATPADDRDAETLSRQFSEAVRSTRRLDDTFG